MRRFFLIAALVVSAATVSHALPAQTGTVDHATGQVQADSVLTRDANSASLANMKWRYPNSGSVAIPSRCSVCELGDLDGSPCTVDGDCTGGGTCIDAICPVFDCDGSGTLDPCSLVGNDTYYEVPECGATGRMYYHASTGRPVCSSDITVDSSGEGLTLNWIELVDDDSNPTCAPGDYKIFADLSETALKKCVNGTVTEIATGGGTGITAVSDFQDVPIIANPTAMECGASLECFEDDANEVSIEVDETEIRGCTSEEEVNAVNAVTENIDSDLCATINAKTDVSCDGKFLVGNRPLHKGPTMEYMIDNFPLDGGRLYVDRFNKTAIASATGAQERMAFPCENLRAISLTFRDKDIAATINWPDDQTLTVGYAVGLTIPGDTLCTYVADGTDASTSCDDIDLSDIWLTQDMTALWLRNELTGGSGGTLSTIQVDILVQVYCGQ